MKKLLKQFPLTIAVVALVALYSCGGNQSKERLSANDSIPNDTIPMDTLYAPSCFVDANCNNRTCQDSIIARHNISQGKFDTMVAAYGTPASSTNYTRSQIKQLCDSLDCTQGDYIGVRYAGGSGAIELFGVVHGTSPATVGKYSIAYMLGLIRKLGLGSNDVFQFHKAKDAANQQTICTRILKANVAVNWGDHIDYYP